MSIVLFSKYIVCSVRCSSCVPLTIKLHSPSFTFPQFSPFSSSSSSHFTPPLNVISDFLTKECGFSSSQVTTLMRRHSGLLRTKSDHAAREVTHLLKDSGFTEKKLTSTILGNPSILTLKVDRQLKPKMELLKKVGLSPQDITHIISRRPRLLNVSLENSLAPRILYLETLFGSKVYLCKALKTAPALLTADFEKQVIPKVEYLKNNIGIMEGTPGFLQALNVLICYRSETLEKKTKHMASLGLAEEEIGQILKRDPRVLRHSTKKMKESIDFLIHTAGLESKIVASNPSILGLSVEKRLKPRYEVFKCLRTIPLPSLTKFFMLGEQEFLAKFGQYNTQVKSNDHTIS